MPFFSDFCATSVAASERIKGRKRKERNIQPRTKGVHFIAGVSLSIACGTRLAIRCPEVRQGESRVETAAFPFLTSVEEAPGTLKTSVLGLHTGFTQASSVNVLYEK